MRYARLFTRLKIYYFLTIQMFRRYGTVFTRLKIYNSSTIQTCRGNIGLCLLDWKSTTSPYYNVYMRYVRLFTRLKIYYYLTIQICRGDMGLCLLDWRSTTYFLQFIPRTIAPFRVKFSKSVSITQECVN